MKIYISGAITNNPNYLSDFNNAQKMLKSKYPEAEIVNPIYIDHKPLSSWVDYMKADIKAMLECDTIYILNSWKRSKGATLEYIIAKHLDFKLMFEEENETWGR